MTSPRTLILCVSVHHQNTATVAHVMATALNAKVCSPQEIRPDGLHEYDLIGFGSGIYFGQFHIELRRWVDDLPKNPDEHRKSFMFSTEGLPCLWRLWHWPIKAKLLKKGYDVVGEFHCGGFDTVGPLQLFGGLNRRHPDEADLARAKVFASQLRLQFATADSSPVV